MKKRKVDNENDNGKKEWKCATRKKERKKVGTREKHIEKKRLKRTAGERSKQK